MRCVMRVAGCCVALMLGVGTMVAQGYSADKPIGAMAQQRPAYLEHAGIVQQLGKPLPMAATFTDETGKSAPLQTWFAGKPVAMAMVYYKCAMLCPQVLHGLAMGLKSTTLMPGKDYEVLVFSIDPTDTPADAVTQRQQFLSEAGMTAHPEAVHFLTAAKPSIDALSAATGFQFVMVPGPDGKMDQFAHSSVVMFTTPDGRMSKYLAGVSYEPRDLRLALLDASEKKISNPVDLLILYCCSYSPTAGSYSVSVMRILGIAGMVSVLVVIGMIYLLTRKPKSHAV
jgi:protein SCO1